MSNSKQDRQGARTPADLERKYNFGKTFAEVYGAATDAQKAADKAQTAANDARVYVDKLDNSLTQEEIFNRLTENGALQGLYMEDGNLYINAKYIANVAALFVEKIISPADEGVFIDMENGEISAKTLRNTDTDSKVDIGSDGTSSEGLFLYRDDIFRMMLATQPYKSALSGFRNWLLTRDDLWIQAADDSNGNPQRIRLIRATDGSGEIGFDVDGIERGYIDVDGYHGHVRSNGLYVDAARSFNGTNKITFDDTNNEIKFFADGTQRGAIGVEGYVGWVKANKLLTEYVRGVNDTARIKMDESTNAIRFYTSGVERGSINADGWHGNFPASEIEGMAAYIVESGTSGYWEYRKWSDGTYECWCTTTDRMSCPNAWGSMFVTTEYSQVTFPVTFDSVPHVQYSADYGSGEAALPIPSTEATSTTKSLRLKYVRPTSYDISVTLNWYVKGKVTT